MIGALFDSSERWTSTRTAGLDLYGAAISRVAVDTLVASPGQPQSEYLSRNGLAEVADQIPVDCEAEI